MAPKNDAEAVRDYMEAYKKYYDQLDVYFPVRKVVPGQKIQLGKPLTAEAIAELGRLAQDMENKRKVWMNFYKTTRSSRR